MRFIQIVDSVTSRPDEVEALGEKYRVERGDRGTYDRVTVARDRDRPGHFLVIAEFPSYEAAMENSDDPATQEFAARMAELCDGPPTFYNLDVQRTDTR
jgi:quinol monooxygenase YgiN